MSAMAEVETTLLLLLDFEPTLPCEVWSHPKTHRPDGPGTWLMAFRCPGCSRARSLVVCDVGVGRARSGMLRCGGCAGPLLWETSVLSCVPIGGAS